MLHRWRTRCTSLFPERRSLSTCCFSNVHSKQLGHGRMNGDKQRSEKEPAKKASIKHFDERSKYIDVSPTLLEVSGVASKALKEEVLQQHMEVLDFGCGTGLLSMAIADSAASVLGVDNSSGMINVLQAKVKDRGPGCNIVRGVCVDLVDPSSLHEANDPSNPYPEQFDLIVSTMTFHHIEDIPATMQLMVKYLKPGGKIAAFDFKKSPWSKRFHPPDSAHTVHHHGGFSSEELCKYFTDAGLLDVACHEVHTFTRPAGDDKSVSLEFELLMAVGTWRQEHTPEPSYVWR